MLHLLRICINMNRVEQKDKNRSNGFTLMELLLAITLFSIIAVAIYSSLAVGIKAQKRGCVIGGEYSDLRLTFYLTSQDLHNAIHANEIYLVSEAQKIYFYSVLPAQDGTRELYKITYTWEREGSYFNLLRLKENYIDSCQEIHEKGDEILDKVSKLEFSYGYVKKEISGEEEFSWKEEWKQESMPKLVQLKIEKNGEKFNKIIYCPAGRMGELKQE